MSLRFNAEALALVPGGICDALWIELKSFELIWAVTFYGRLIKMIRSCVSHSGRSEQASDVKFCLWLLFLSDCFSNLHITTFSSRLFNHGIWIEYINNLVFVKIVRTLAVLSYLVLLTQYLSLHQRMY